MDQGIRMHHSRYIELQRSSEEDGENYTMVAWSEVKIVSPSGEMNGILDKSVPLRRDPRKRMYEFSLSSMSLRLSSSEDSEAIGGCSKGYGIEHV